MPQPTPPNPPKNLITLYRTETSDSRFPSRQFLACLPSPDAAPAQLQADFGAFEITIYHDPKTLVDSLKMFLRVLHAQWPFAAFFCRPESEFLKLIFVRNLRETQTLTAPDGTLKTVHDPEEVAMLLRNFAWGARELGQRAQMDPRLLQRRLNHLHAYMRAWTGVDRQGRTAP